MSALTAAVSAVGNLRGVRLIPREGTILVHIREIVICGWTLYDRVTFDPGSRRLLQR